MCLYLHRFYTVYFTHCTLYIQGTVVVRLYDELLKFSDVAERGELDVKKLKSSLSALS
jgi:hypothetical protein